MVDTHTKYRLGTSGGGSPNILTIALRDNSNSIILCSQWTGLWGRIKIRKLSNCILPCKKMGKGELRNMKVCTGPSIPEPGTVLQLVCAGVMECQAPASNTYDIRHRIGVNNGDKGSFKRWIGSGYD